MREQITHLSGILEPIRRALERGARATFPWHWLFPVGLFYIPFLVIPIGIVFVFSLFSWTSITDLTFVGLANYERVLTDGFFYAVLGNTITYTLGNTVLTVGGGLILALSIQAAYSRVRVVLQTLYLLPYAIMPVGVGMIWALMYHPQVGAVNTLLETVGIGWQPQWLGSDLALYSVIFAGSWQSVGFYTVIWLVGLASIDQRYYEAAKIDGAGAIARFRYVTLPLLKPIGVFLILISIITSLRIFGLVWIMTRGGPGYASEVMVTWMYRVAFIENNFGLAAAIGVILFCLTLVVAAGISRVFGLTEEGYA